MESLHQFELPITLFFQSLGSWLKTPMLAFSFFGTESFYMILMPLLYWCLDASLGLRVGIMLMLGNSLNGFFKLAFGWPRPYWVSPAVHAYSAESSFGMPSGHAQVSTGVFGMLAAGANRRWVKWAAAGLVLFIGLSRIYLGVHWTSDVLAGWLLGGLTLLLYLRLEKPVARWLAGKGLGMLITLALLASLVLLAVNLLPLVTYGGWTLDPQWSANAQAQQPGTPLDPLAAEGSFTAAGTLFGMLAGAAWLRRKAGGFDASGNLQQIALRYAIGVVGVLILWYGLGSVFPRTPDALGYSLRFIRYALLGWWVAALAPLLFRRLGLARGSQAAYN